MRFVCLCIERQLVCQLQNGAIQAFGPNIPKSLVLFDHFFKFCNQSIYFEGKMTVFCDSGFNEALYKVFTN